MQQKKLIKFALPIWEYLSISSKPIKADAIFVFGGNDVLIARKAAQLYLQGYARTILITGANGPFSKKIVSSSEAALFAEEAIRLGVPKKAILIEERATNTGENVEYGMKVLLRENIHASKCLLVAKPFLMRRCVATFNRKFPSITVVPVCPDGNLLIYQDRPLAQFALRLVEEIERIEKYPQLGYISKQNIPINIRKACKRVRQFLECERKEN